MQEIICILEFINFMLFFNKVHKVRAKSSNFTTMLRNVGEQSGESVESVLNKKTATWKRFAETKVLSVE